MVFADVDVEIAKDPSVTVGENQQQQQHEIEKKKRQQSRKRGSRNSTTLSNSSSYTELKINGPPLYNQGALTGPEHSIPTATGVVDSSLSLHADTTALLVVDVQPQYWSQCPAVRKDFPNFPNNMQNLIRICRQRGAPVIWVYADYHFDHSPWLKQFHRLHQGRIPPEVHFDDKTGWEPFAQPLPHEVTIAKSSWSSTTSTKLLDLLKRRGVDTVLVCGLITSVCVQHSAFGVFEAGHRTILVTDACADRGLERHKAALALYGDYMYELKTVESLNEELIENGNRIVSSHDEDSTDEDVAVVPSRKRVKTVVVG